MNSFNSSMSTQKRAHMSAGRHVSPAPSVMSSVAPTTSLTQAQRKVNPMQSQVSSRHSSDDSWWKTWGLLCSDAFDLQELECSFQSHTRDKITNNEPTDPSKAACSHPGTCAAPAAALVKQLGCHTSAPEASACCAREEAEPRFTLFAPCMVCTMRFASVVEVPCGHLNVCTECHREYQTNTRCIRCRENVPIRVDISPFLDEVTGKPELCKLCRTFIACTVMIPCAHMSFCNRCLPKSVVGCPTCGQKVEQTCQVLWSVSCEETANTRGLAGMVFPTMPASTGSFPSHRGSRDVLAQATEDVDEEIARLERQLSKLKHVPSTDGCVGGTDGGLSENRYSPRGGLHFNSSMSNTGGSFVGGPRGAPGTCVPSGGLHFNSAMSNGSGHTVHRTRTDSFISSADSNVGARQGNTPAGVHQPHGRLATS
eukprot:TRINITY_DN49004_c0_g1_i1.p1 TRINITY_DN49004_c0_g1~~TRINITY_DN49004_c0_g1_i1.p1  ORF type:complete len:426 (+),score=44.58 TRINITY_DN49004_c0_g1_i1:152-1429(+)